MIATEYHLILEKCIDIRKVHHVTIQSDYNSLHLCSDVK